jgi:phosphinothricin acetyltransferase
VTSDNLTIRGATAEDAPAILAIYNHYITNTVVTFEEVALPVDEMTRRMRTVADASLPWLVAERAGTVIGYTYATKWSARVGYRFSVEITVYLAPTQGGRGIGSALYTELFAQLRALGIRNVIGGIALPNDASVALHEKLGLRKVAHYTNIGIKFDRWLDVGYWQGAL